MTLQELYTNIEGDYQAALKTMITEGIAGRMIVKLPTDTSCEKMLEAGRRMDATGIFEGAHALKGVCASLGLTKMSGMAGEICEEFRPGNSRQWTDTQVQDRLAAIQALYKKTLAGIQEYAAKS